ncbi:hypothetical protein DFH07DRAFT_785445 [Mycena maculata]|uniref:Uncharacterized protein n=1 Tax=Mycena maculata TaxID=230809 RepID=A0AAD7HAA8_9AGAR|nr:hypothetical protein DFH07DRAFT_785445 [Mycena maculata]
MLSPLSPLAISLLVAQALLLPVSAVQQQSLADDALTFRRGLLPNSGHMRLDARLPRLHQARTYESPWDPRLCFASTEHDVDIPSETPRIMALGNGTSTPGVNQKLLPWLRSRKGKRFGIIMLDFFDSVRGMVEAVIGS